MKRIAFPCLCLLLLTVTSCRRDTAVRSALAHAEAVMEENPGAARQILDSLSLTQPSPQGKGFRSPRLQEGMGEASFALYALLRTQAEHKCRVRAKSDSLPLIATRYYGTKRKTQPAALAQHYLGCAYSDMGRDLEAMDAFLRASTLFPDTTNKYFANNLFELGLLYTNHHMPDSAWFTFSRYRQTAVCNSDSANIGYADYYLGTIAMRKGSNEVADSLFHCVEDNSKSTRYIRYSNYFQLAQLYFYRKHDIENALTYLKLTENYFGEENGALLSLKADILTEQQQFAQAYELYKKAIRNNSDIYTRCSSYERLASIAPLLNKPDSTQYYIGKYKVLLDTIYTQSKQKEIAEVKDKHIVEIHDQQLKARHTRFLFWTWTGAVALLLGIAIVFLLIDRKRKSERLKYEAQLKQIRQDQLTLAIRPEEETQSAQTAAFDINSQEKRKELYSDKYKSSEWPHYFQLHSGEIEKGDYMPSADKERFNNYLNAQLVDILLDLVKENPKLKSLDAEHCAMTLLGFRMKQIAYVSNSSYDACCMRRTRMRSRMTSEWYQFLFEKPLKD